MTKRGTQFHPLKCWFGSKDVPSKLVCKFTQVHTSHQSFTVVNLTNVHILSCTPSGSIHQLVFHLQGKYIFMTCRYEQQYRYRDDPPSYHPLLTYVLKMYTLANFKIPAGNSSSTVIVNFFYVMHLVSRSI
jgi:hypothetical protein